MEAFHCKRCHAVLGQVLEQGGLPALDLGQVWLRRLVSVQCKRCGAFRKWQPWQRTEETAPPEVSRTSG
jgi:RNase P subunit RPR2